MNEQTKPNRLAREKSPYLLQHAHNPVDWYPWGEEAFAKARKEDKPIFLSVGYSTCHWCHVMEEESFVNPAIAELLNRHFVSVKVDREERPDIDQVYMQAVQAMSGSGGWPMSVFLTQDLKPFYGGTYFPPEDRWGRPGFTTVLTSIYQKWMQERDNILRAGEELAEHLKAHAARGGRVSASLQEETLKAAYAQLDGTFDVRYGGFGGAPKFPRSHDLSLLLRYWRRTGEKKALGMVETTLAEMGRGGIYDHLGGGFHRYSTDHKWHVPHFEKMLYDQALIAKTYLEAYQASGKADYGRTVRGILDYVQRSLRHEEGGFFSAEDADSAADKEQPSKKTEGAFYVWSAAEISGVLGEELSAIFNDYYGVRPDGNAENDPHGEFTGKNILHETRSLQELAEKYGKTHEELEKLLCAARKRLFDARTERLSPHLDDKILTDWNGLMISAFACSGRVLNEPAYLKTARQAARFIWESLRKDGRLYHRWRMGEAAIPAFLDDYAFLIQAYLDLYEAEFEAADLETACTLLKEALLLFWDDAGGGGFFFTPRSGEKMIYDAKELYDGAIPSGNSVMTLNLLRLARMTMNPDLERKAERTLDYFSETIQRYPAGFTQMLAALDFVLGPSCEVVLAGGGPSLKPLLETLDKSFSPNKVVLLHDKNRRDTALLHSLSPFVVNQEALGGRATAYVCKNHACDLPVYDPVRFLELLEKK